MKKFKKLFWTLGIALFLNVGITQAVEIPENDGWVTDQANVLSESEEAQLETQIQSVEQNTTAEIAVLTISSLEGEAIARFATDTGHAWGVGKEDTDNGVMIVIAVEDQEFFIATGYGVEGILPDVRAKQIGDKNFPPYFRDGNYFAGIQAALRDIEGFLQQDESIISQYQSTHSQHARAEETGFHWSSFFWVGLFLLFGGLKIWVKKQKKDKKKKRKRKWLSVLVLTLVTFFGMWILSATLAMGIVFGLIVLPLSIGLLFAKSVSTSGRFGGGSGRSGGFGSGGGFGGFGGGGFGGGGGGGRW